MSYKNPTDFRAWEDVPMPEGIVRVSLMAATAIAGGAPLEAALAFQKDYIENPDYARPLAEDILQSLAELYG